jgi:hypothetical protein
MRRSTRTARLNLDTKAEERRPVKLGTLLVPTSNSDITCQSRASLVRRKGAPQTGSATSHQSIREDQIPKQVPKMQVCPLRHWVSVVHVPPPTQVPVTQVWPSLHWSLFVQALPPTQMPATQI